MDVHEADTLFERRGNITMNWRSVAHEKIIRPLLPPEPTTGAPDPALLQTLGRIAHQTPDDIMRMELYDALSGIIQRYGTLGVKNFLNYLAQGGGRVLHRQRDGLYALAFVPMERIAHSVMGKNQRMLFFAASLLDKDPLRWLEAASARWLGAQPHRRLLGVGADGVRRLLGSRQRHIDFLIVYPDGSFGLVDSQQLTGIGGLDVSDLLVHMEATYRDLQRNLSDAPVATLEVIMPMREPLLLPGDYTLRIDSANGRYRVSEARTQRDPPLEDEHGTILRIPFYVETLAKP